MEQFFLKHRAPSVFQANAFPQLAYLYMTDAEEGKWFRAAHSHKNTVEVSTIVDGDIDYTVNGKTLHAMKGDFIVMNAGMTHAERSDNPRIRLCCVGIRNLALHGRRKNSLLENETGPLFSESSFRKKVSDIVRMIYEAIRWQDGICREEIIENLLKVLICLVLEAEREKKDAESLRQTDRQKKNDPDRELLENLREYLDQHYKENISLDALAGYFFVGKYHMCHIFKEKYGSSIIDYVIGRRIGEAQTLLVETDYRIADIASELGFSSAGYFSTQFLKRVGRTPFEYRALKERKG